MSLGFTQPDIRYEWNKLYVLGLHHRTTHDGIKNYIERISGYDVKYVKWFKPNGKAIVALQTEKISGKQGLAAFALREKENHTVHPKLITIQRHIELSTKYYTFVLTCFTSNSS